MASLFSELRRRNVFRVGIAYIVMTWLLLQIVDVVAPMLALPDWIGKMILLLLGIGLPVALFFAWAFELTPEGLKKEKEIDRSKSITPQTGRKLDFVIIGMLVIALGYFVATHDWGGRGVDVAGGPSIAVLPFVNRSADADSSAFFADGIHDDLLTVLANISSLKVISRT